MVRKRGKGSSLCPLRSGSTGSFRVYLKQRLAIPPEKLDGVMVASQTYVEPSFMTLIEPVVSEIKAAIAYH